jgi:hypothetical protein
MTESSKSPDPGIRRAAAMWEAYKKVVDAAKAWASPDSCGVEHDRLMEAIKALKRLEAAVELTQIAQENGEYGRGKI